MAKFRFKLTTLLQLREATRDERRAELARAYQAEEIIQAEQHRLEQELHSLARQHREATGPGELDIDHLLEDRRYGMVLNHQLGHTSQQLKEVQAEIERRRNELVEATREVRVLETLREKQLARHQKEEDRRLVNLLDEVASRTTLLKEDDS